MIKSLRTRTYSVVCDEHAKADGIEVEGTEMSALSGAYPSVIRCDVEDCRNKPTRGVWFFLTVLFEV